MQEHIPESGGDAGGNAGGNAGGDAGVGGAGDQQEDKGDDVSIQLDDTVASDVPLPLPVKEETEYSETGNIIITPYMYMCMLLYIRVCIYKTILVYIA